MVKNAETGIFKALSNVETHRRIGLTGSPIQNNLLEYYRMVSWIRPGLLGTEAEFEANYIIPITSGLPSDATQEAIRLSDEKSTELHEFLAPFVHRKDASVLKDEVPFMQQVILHIRPSKLQTQLYGAAKRFPDRNFFKLFQALKPVHNHPGCLLMKPSGQPAKVIIGNQAGPTKGQQTSHKGTNASKKDPPDDQEGIAAAHCCSLSTEGPRENGNNANANKCDVDNPVTSDSASALDNSVTTTKPLTSPENDTFDVEDDAAKMLHYAATNNEAEKWWMKIAQRVGLDEMKNINNGYKIVLFLHILVLAQRNGEKVMVFTKCCRTLDFIEEILNLEDWGAHVKSLRSELGEDKMGKWRKNVDYLRIDGQVGSSERGELVTKFNDITQSANLFLISKAGGIGVNLVAASRVSNSCSPVILI
jgi:transcriptional regulator ATRX